MNPTLDITSPLFFPFDLFPNLSVWANLLIVGVLVLVAFVLLVGILPRIFKVMILVGVVIAAAAIYFGFVEVF